MSKVTTGEVILSYAQVWEARSFEGGKPKYSTQILIDKSDKDTLKDINTAIRNAMEQGVAKGYWKSGTDPKSFRNPVVRDGDVERSDDPAYKGKFFISAKSINKPIIVDQNVQEILDRDEIYSGVIAKVHISFYPYSMSTNKGLACGLEAIQKVADGERLDGGGVDVKSVFGKVDSFSPVEELGDDIW